MPFRPRIYKLEYFAVVDAEGNFHPLRPGMFLYLDDVVSIMKGAPNFSLEPRRLHTLLEANQIIWRGDAHRFSPPYSSRGE